MKLTVPIVLNLVSVILLTGSAWQGVCIYDDAQTRRRTPRTGKAFTRLLARAGDQQESAWLDSAAMANLFAEANFVGTFIVKIPDGPESDPGDHDDVKPSLEQILEVSAIAFASHGPSRVIVTYREEPGAEVPQQDLSRGLPGTGRERRTQRLKLEDRLRKPHDHFRLVRIAADASCIWFVREDQPGGEEVALCRVEFELSESLVRALAGAFVPAPHPGRNSAEEQSQWSPSKETLRVADNSWSIGKDDVARVRVDGLQRIFREDLSLSGYASRSGVRGLQVSRVSPRMKGLGVVSGDVIIGVNGESVATKAKAIVVLRRLYKRGVRSFDIDFLSRGRQVTRTYRVPD